MKLPGPDHTITIERNANRVRITFAGQVIAETTRALTLAEANYAPVQYIPREDTKMDLLNPTTHTSHCPYKGNASHFSIQANGRVSENSIWSYEHPFPAMTEIAGYLAFYPQRVDKIEVTPA
jgi:uncharacterized protein (DUF427 family)